MVNRLLASGRPGHPDGPTPDPTDAHLFRMARSLLPPCPPALTLNVRVGFLFNHAHVHQMLHVAPILAALVELNGSLEIHAFVTGQDRAAFLESLLPASILARIHWHEIEPPPLARGLERLLGQSIPLERVGTLVRHRHRLAAMDALVVPETTSLQLKTRRSGRHYSCGLGTHPTPRPAPRSVECSPLPRNLPPPAVRPRRH